MNATKPKLLTAAQRKKALKEVPDEYLFCRIVRHSWRYGDVDENSTPGVYIQEMICPLCGTRKYQDIDAHNGRLLNTRMHYEKDYLLKGLGRMTADDNGLLRLRSIGKKI